MDEMVPLADANSWVYVRMLIRLERTLTCACPQAIARKSLAEPNLPVIHSYTPEWHQAYLSMSQSLSYLKTVLQ